MKITYTYYNFNELIEALKACETLGLYYKVEKTIKITPHNTPLDAWVLKTDPEEGETNVGT